MFFLFHQAHTTPSHPSGMCLCRRTQSAHGTLSAPSLLEPLPSARAASTAGRAHLAAAARSATQPCPREPGRERLALSIVRSPCLTLVGTLADLQFELVSRHCRLDSWRVCVCEPAGAPVTQKGVTSSSALPHPTHDVSVRGTRPATK